MSPKDDKLTELIDTAHEAETDPDRHEMEGAVLATVAHHGMNTLWAGFNTLNWSRKDYKAIADALFQADFTGGKADRVLVCQHLAAAGHQVADAVLTPILDGSMVREPSVAARYIDIMDRQDRLGHAADAGRDYLEAVDKAKKEGGDADAAVSGLLKAVNNLTRSRHLIREHPVEAEAAAGFLDKLAARRTDNRAWLGLDSGFKHLNEVLNGLPEGIIILAGAPGTGKTTLAKQIADTVADTEKVPVLFWSYEQSAEELRIKSLGRMASVDTRSIWKGRTDAGTWEKVEQADEEYRHGPGPTLTVIEAGRDDTMDRIRAAALLAKYNNGDRPILAVIDYLQIIPASKGAPDTVRERVDYILSDLRRLSRDIQSPILVISSENRDAYRNNEKPTLAALKESGGIEYTADAVVCLWRNKDETESLTRDCRRLTIRVEARILKNRNGAPGNVKLDFTPAWALFDEAGLEGLDWADTLGK